MARALHTCAINSERISTDAKHNQSVGDSNMMKQSISM